MLDNLQNQNPSSFYQGDDENEYNNENSDLGFKPKTKRINNGIFFGLKPLQLFILLVLLLIVVFLLGAMFLLITGKVVPSFL